MILRPYQADLKRAIEQAWCDGARNIAAQLPTGGGKTAICSRIVQEHSGACAVLAHRKEIVEQWGIALAREGVRHRIIGPSELRRHCISRQMEELGRTTFDTNAACAIASVQSIKAEKLDTSWAARVGLWVQDEAHHLLVDNQFGRATACFPNARGLGVTATPERLDGKGLGRHAHGVMDALVQGPAGSDLIEMGYLSPYRIFAPPSTLHRDAIRVTSGGDFDPAALREETKRSTVTGDIVKHYCDRALGKLGLTFADSIPNAETIAAKFEAAGVRAAVLTGETKAALRTVTLRQFKRRDILQIVSVALIDEGFDCPAVEVVSDGAATESFGRFAQRFGRGLRVLEGKDHLLYFDHVGNVIRHGRPDAPRQWSLDARSARELKPSDAIPLRACPQCALVYERFRKACPYCGHVVVPAQRSGPEFVDGDLLELDPSVLDAMRARVAQIDGPPRIPYGLPPIAAAGAKKRHRMRQEAQAELREAIALWAGWHREQGRDDSESYRRFYHAFGMDVLSAQALGRPDAEALTGRVQSMLDQNGVIAK